MPARTPQERSQSARIGAFTRWGKEDPVEGTAKARKAFLSRFDRQADPDGVLDPEERARRAASLRRAHFIKLALKSAQARRRQKVVDETNGRPDQAPAAETTSDAADAGPE